MFPEGFKFSSKNKVCRTSKVNLIFDLTNSFRANYIIKKEKTQILNVPESRFVAGAGFISLQARKWALWGGSTKKTQCFALLRFNIKLLSQILNNIMAGFISLPSKEMGLMGWLYKENPMLRIVVI